VAKFDDDQPSNLRDWAAKKGLNYSSKTEWPALASIIKGQPWDGRKRERNG